jgi:hypothetical protein
MESVVVQTRIERDQRRSACSESYAVIYRELCN